MTSRINRKNGLLIAASAIALTALPAHAQEATPTEDAASESGLGEIIVTAQKRSQNLQDVPAAVSAFKAEDLAARGVSETSDLMGSLPNLQVTSAYSDTQPNFSLRGISVANEFSASTASPVGVYVDEVYQSFRASHGQQLYDLFRRGPRVGASQANGHHQYQFQGLLCDIRLRRLAARCLRNPL